MRDTSKMPSIPTKALTRDKGGFLLADQHSAVAIYNTHIAAEAALKVLQAAAIDIEHVSIAGKDRRTEEHVVGYCDAGDRLKYWGKLGAFGGGVWDLVLGAAFFWMPGLGPVQVGGPLVASIAGVLEGATVNGGLTTLGAALHGMGIPRSSVISYESALKANKCLLIFQGAADEASDAKEILRKTDVIEVAAHVG